MKIFNPTTDQEFFNTAYKGILKQGCPATLNDERVSFNVECAYLNARGEKCGIGQCMTDEALKAAQNAILTVNELLDYLKNRGFKHPNFNDEMLNFLDDLQQAHDIAAGESEQEHFDNFIELFKKNMKELAKDWNLKVPSILT